MIMSVVFFRHVVTSPISLLVHWNIPLFRSTLRHIFYVVIRLKPRPSFLFGRVWVWLRDYWSLDSMSWFPGPRLECLASAGWFFSRVSLGLEWRCWCMIHSCVGNETSSMYVYFKIVCGWLVGLPWTLDCPPVPGPPAEWNMVKQCASLVSRFPFLSFPSPLLFACFVEGEPVLSHFKVTEELVNKTLVPRDDLPASSLVWCWREKCL